MASELVALAPDVLLAPGGASMGPLHEATRDIPIVFTIVPDPVAAGFVESLAARAATRQDLRVSSSALVGNGWVF